MGTPPPASATELGTPAGTLRTSPTSEPNLSGTPPHVSKVNQNAYQTLLTRQVAKLHPQGVLFRRRPPPACVVYAELVTTTKNYLRTVTEVDPSWLGELCPQHFAATPKATLRSET